MIDKNKIKRYNKTRTFSKRKIICHAPEKTLRFSLSGNILACCYNRKYSLGKFPEDNLHDIWFGNKRKVLANRIFENDFSLGCHKCKDEIINENFNSVGAKQYDYLQESSLGFPVMFDFEISNICNLECIMCSGENSSLIRKNIEKLPPLISPYNDDFVYQLQEFLPHLREARFVGGEPFLMDINYKIWEKIIELNPNIEISVLTNGTIFNDRIKDLLKKGNFKISISIDSFNKQTYESIRKNADFEEVMSNLKYFHSHSKENKYTFNINICPIRQNWKELPEIVNYCNKNNFNIIFHTVVFPPNTSLWNLSKEELTRIIEFLNKSKFKGKTKQEKANEAVYNNLIKQLENWEEKSYDKKSDNMLYNMTVEELKQSLYRKIKEQSEKDKYIDTIEKSFETIQDFEIIHKALISLNKMSVKDIIAEIEISTQEKITERIKTAARI